MTHQPAVVTPFVVHQARLLLGQAETLLPTPAAKRHRQQRHYRRGGGIAQELFHLRRRLVDRYQQ
jgi:hypothetical protein